MQLTRLEILGFKSFAQKVTVKFDDGLTGVIGPNGCGKSNIVDAIRWVLGEQRPSVLRCDRMENLIFGGTETRKPLGLAEVSLYIENSKNILPSEYSELKLTRRLFRSGESEYHINNQSVRLMDITNLFADTGMGADAYSVIELKMVEQILSDNAQERRRLFEEAAGIKKYKARRRSALLKLDTTQQELTRLEDIVAEVQKSVNSLSRQVGKARRYHEYKQRIGELEMLLAFLRINAYRNDLAPLKAESEEVTRARDTLSKEVRVAEADLEKQQAASVDAEKRYRDAAGELYRRDEKIQEIQSKRSLRQQRIESLGEAVRVFRSELEQRQQRIVVLEKDNAALQAELSTNNSEMQAAQEQYREFANQQLEIELSHQKFKDEYQAFVQENLKDLQESNESRDRAQKLKIEQESVNQQLERRRDNYADIERQLGERQAELDVTAKSAAEAEEAHALYQEELKAADVRIASLRAQIDETRDAINVAEGKLEKSRNRRDFLDNLINNYEGFSQSVQYVMSNKKQFNGVVDTLANLIDCDEAYRPALESFLAEISNYLVVEEVDTAREILRNLKAESRGRMTVVPLSLLNDQSDSPSLPEPTDTVFPLAQVVRFPESYRRLFNFLLRRVVLVADLETAIEYRKQFPGLNYVTLSGEVLESWGNVTGGSGSGSGQGLIGRKEEHQKVIARIADIDAELKTLRETLAEDGSDLEKLQHKKSEFENLLQSTGEEKTSLDKKLSLTQYDVSRLQQTLQEIQLESQQSRDRLAEIENALKKLAPHLQDYERRMKSYQEKELNLQEKQQEMEQQLRQLTRATQEKQINYLTLTSQEKEKLQRVEFLEQSIREAGDFIHDREQRILENEKQIGELKTEIETIAADLDKLFAERDKAEDLKNSVEKQVQEFRTAIQASEEELKKKQRMWNQARERLQELELHSRELEVRLNTVIEQVKEKYGEEALNFDIKELDPSLSINGVQEELEAFRKKIEALGDVNPLAIKEHDKEKERLDFLNAQRDDLLSARDQLLETIEKLNTTARKQFMEVFQQIEVNFEKVFSEFFAGGHAKLKLVESRDPLEANIEISIFHKGKDLKTLTLLSAGEKTLTAISLLFAIYLVKPSPFCILDEVDAPLDDVNISRFTNALGQFADETQFILVTHNKKTMEATDSIYGVTMEERGVSKVVSVRFD